MACAPLGHGQLCYGDPIQQKQNLGIECPDDSPLAVLFIAALSYCILKHFIA